MWDSTTKQTEHTTFPERESAQYKRQCDLKWKCYSSSNAAVDTDRTTNVHARKCLVQRQYKLTHNRKVVVEKELVELQ